MNIKNICFIILSALTSFSCYTVAEKPDIPEREFKYGNHIIVGEWFKQESLYDYTYREKRLEIFPDGDITFYPDPQRSPLEYFNGTYRIEGDTVIIKFFRSSYSERFYYYADDEVLELEQIERVYRRGYPVSSPLEGLWVRDSY